MIKATQTMLSKMQEIDSNLKSEKYQKNEDECLVCFEELLKD